MGLLQFTEQGIFCKQGNFHIDPWKPVDHAIITHAHSDHARAGNKHYLSHANSQDILKYRLGNISLSTLNYNEVVSIHGVKVSLHPAGHIIGSSQIRVEHKGEVWVVSGDYKTEDDKFCEPFEPVRCNTFISECTFGLPIFNWKPQDVIHQEIMEWWRSNAEQNTCSILIGYALGKAQRLLRNLHGGPGKIYTHGAIDNIHKLLPESYKDLFPESTRVTSDMKPSNFRTSIILAPTSALNSPWLKRFEPYSIGIASGWMQLRGARRRRSVDRGFPMSDHADWTGLQESIRATGAEKVILTHGYTSPFAQWLNEEGIHAEEETTNFEAGFALEQDTDPAL